ncbi:flagellar biosynthesis protein FlhF [Halalkalibacterium halodurans]|uniref:flagellar biosynthesis protein FlhF n=1 Tax=Halalkalibacterium halodurans TaxID=86665 RepID=UPI002E1C6E8E|nr:flagellar biosynthesis protein FlhF [Halalkalibacterium halodurans]MED4081566.1 flagellar biosynthesis protein FlhF [Halalkalibacterium halodurans]MED4086182.1 flagellar biosynthesis protein FlhF [Halalkalibacterium halodurans]MED4106176.1 flagellar biosynthesis protein FlhF [Halalkalibacterium halodurans]MED4108589.1 flagellar biosynthesis protein FlhF [Halalkalibacterium halodurans]MED4149174.1 flagellar biosynthesis protein FlhF [Halalkalibacterium halodurans]
MKVKKYVASSMGEAMEKIRVELGEHAVILNSKEIETGGFLGFFTKKKLEVIAAIDPIERAKVTLPPKKRKGWNVDGRPSSVNEKSTESLLVEIQELKKMMQTINIKETSMQSYPEPFHSFDEQLKQQEVCEAVRLQLVKHLLQSWLQEEGDEQTPWSYEELLTKGEQLLKRKLSLLPEGGITFQKKFVNIVGPTGVGKTTTIAKLAAHSVLKKKKKVALITTDTYRIAAVEQLKTYAKILNIPLEVVYSMEDFQKAKNQFIHYDLVLVDSAGRNFRNALYVKELEKVIDFKHEAENYLVLSLTGKYRDMKAIIEQFSLVPIKQIIFTKQDETDTYGAMLNMMFEQGKGVAYVTNGQNVPDDIVESSNDWIIQTILGAKGHA